MVDNCTNYSQLYSSSSFHVGSVLAAAAGAITVLCAVSTIVVIVLSKSYKTYHFRLILYYCISATLFGVANSINRIDYAFASDPARRNQSCAWVGFYFQCTLWSLLISILSVTLGINVKTTFRRDVKSAEAVSLLATFLLPLLINWIPFVGQGYGQWGNYCIIRIYSENCELFHFGNISAVVFIGLPWTVGMLVIITATVASIALIVYRTRTRKDADKGYDDLVKTVTRKEALSLLWCPFVLLLLLAPIIALLADDPLHPTVWLWGVCEFLVALDPGLIAIAYTARKYLFVLAKCRILYMCCRKLRETTDNDED